MRSTRDVSSVFVVQHSYDLGASEEAKFIGVYSSRDEAEAAIGRLTGQPGFRDRPAGFHIDAYEVDQDHWQEGVTTLVTVMVALLDENVDVWRPVQAEVLPGKGYRLVGPNVEGERWAFGTGQLVLCEERLLGGQRHLVAVSLAGGAA